VTRAAFLSRRTRLSVVLVISLLRGAGPIMAAGPCSPFEGRPIDAGILMEMRQAAGDRRLYRVDPDLSKVGFCVRHFPFREFRGEFTNIVGGLALPPEPTGHGHALLLIHTSSLQSNEPDMLPLVTGQSFMDTTRYPEILFVGRKLEWLGPVQAHLYGELTLRGRTRPVLFDVEIETLAPEDADEAGHIRLRGRSHVSRFNFDMHGYRLVVSETVQLCLAMELVRWSK
jgi:polyisoprenoid-binding protein YceI